jgi:hypothetical protein
METLSPLQRHILRWLIGQVRIAEQQDREGWFKGDVAWMLTWVALVADRTEDKALENVWRASVCRSLARLEKRGLVIRIKGPKKARTVGVRFTREGRRVAEALIGN